MVQSRTASKRGAIRLVNSEAEFIELFQQLLHTVIHTALFSGFCYTQFTDTFQEANGLLYRRPYAKDSSAADRGGDVSFADARARSRVVHRVQLMKPDGRCLTLYAQSPA